MRKIRIIALVFIGLLLFSSCKDKNKDFSTPERVMEKFSVAFVTADFDAMYKYSVAHDAALFRNLQKYMRNNPERLKMMNESKVEVLDTKCKYVNDSLAVCTCHFTCNNEKKSLEFRVKKQEEKWLVDVSED